VREAPISFHAFSFWEIDTRRALEGGLYKEAGKLPALRDWQTARRQGWISYIYYNRMRQAPLRVGARRRYTPCPSRALLWVSRASLCLSP